jgi:ribosomal protein L37AE/L43A
MITEVYNFAFLMGIIIIIVLFVGGFYLFKMQIRTTQRNQCPHCHQNYGKRISTPFVYDTLRNIKHMSIKTYKCLSCNSVFFVKYH